jgi:kumamolisin
MNSGRRTLQNHAGKVGMAIGFGALVFAIDLAWAQQPAQPAAPAAAANRKVFTNSVTPLPVQEGLTPQGLNVAAAGPQHQNDKLDLLFSLPVPADSQSKLEERVARGVVITPEDLERDYSAKAADADALAAWLKAQGFEVTHTSPDRTSLYARATVAQIQKSLLVNFARVSKDGITYNAARNAPSLPTDVGAGVHAIIGLQPYRRAQKQFRRHMPANGNRMSSDESASNGGGFAESASAEGAIPTPNIANSPPYLVSEVLAAYNARDLSVTGAGQKIAVLIDTFPVDSDLRQFWKRNKLSVTTKQVEKINVKNVLLPPLEGEETRDVEWTTGIAPGATVRVYASGSLNFVDLDRALDRIIADLPSQPGMRQLSISLGLGETFMGSPGTPSGEVASQHLKFLKLAAAGVNVFVSTGDAGSNPDETGHGGDGPLQAEFQSSDPMVVAVGGTVLHLDTATGKVFSEAGWMDGGGGSSIFFPRPAYQVGRGVAPGTRRLVPDVSLAADPSTGAFVFFQGQPQQIGGTSWSAPTWAGFCALINEARTKAGKPALPFLNPLIYPLIGSDSFRDITSGNNGAFNAGTGHDLVTGVGVPNVKALMEALTK